MHSPLVSVIMPVHNAARFLRGTIDSVKDQTLTDWELLVADDHSTDGSAEIIAGLAAADPRIRPLRTPENLGAGGARNLAMDAARGKWLAFLDADDLWHPHKLNHQIAAMTAARIPFSCTAYQRHDIARGRMVVIGVPPRAARGDLLKTNTVACSTAMIERALVGAHRMAPIRRRQDFLFWLDLLQITPEVLGVPEMLMTYHQHSQSLSAPKGRAAANNWAMYRRSLGLPLLPAMWYFGHYAVRGLLRYKAPLVARRLGWLHDARPHDAAQGGDDKA